MVGLCPKCDPSHPIDVAHKHQDVLKGVPSGSYVVETQSYPDEKSGKPIHFAVYRCTRKGCTRVDPNAKRMVEHLLTHVREDEESKKTVEMQAKLATVGRSYSEVMAQEVSHPTRVLTSQQAERRARAERRAEAAARGEPSTDVRAKSGRSDLAEERKKMGFPRRAMTNIPGKKGTYRMNFRLPRAQLLARDKGRPFGAVVAEAWKKKDHPVAPEPKGVQMVMTGVFLDTKMLQEMAKAEEKGLDLDRWVATLLTAQGDKSGKKGGK